MEVKDVLQCSFPSWYKCFKKVTPRSIILPVPKGFIEYLTADGVILPDSKEHWLRPANVESDDSDDDEEAWENSDATTAEAPRFDEFDVKIKEAIKDLGGKVFPKLNWSSPRDASWIALNNSCCCTTVSDVYLLLKSSDFIMHDITQPFLMCVDYDNSLNDTATEINQEVQYCLVLRQWLEINPDTEFRCFVKDGCVIGITQRDPSIYSDYNISRRNHIMQDILSFYTEHIHNRFPASNYVFDVVRKKRDDVYLLDFNPFGAVTDSVLFDWNELIDGRLTAGNGHIPEYRCVDRNRGIQPRPFSYYSIPKDIVDMSVGEDPFKLIDFLNLKIDEQKRDLTTEE